MPEHSSMTHNSQPRIAILLCTYQGEEYLAEQLASFEKQTLTNWQVHASDDDSQDLTRSILENYKCRWSAGRLSIYTGPVQGFVANFISLVKNNTIHADYFAFSDQDDIWQEDKLERAIQNLAQVPADIPALYCSRTRLVDENNKPIKLSPLFTKEPSFANAVMQSLGGGNTMVLNQAARDLLCETCDYMPHISHDWWAYMIVSGCGGRVFYDASPSVHYRQHDTNVVGMNSTWEARLTRLRMLWQGYLRDWNDSNIAALKVMRDKLTPKNQEILDRLDRARKMSCLPRLIELKRSGIHRQTLFDNIGLFAAALFGKI